MLGRAVLVLFALSALTASPGHAWGDRTHRFLTRAAIRTLPPQAAAYYGPHVDALVELCLEPDSVMRAREGRAEAIRHFIDLDAHMPAPFTGFPRTYDGAVRRFGRRNVEKNGVLPWVILRFERQLREAIRRGDLRGALREAGYLSHYVADSFQPLHLTANYDGQKTGARGLHRRYENDLVDARIDRYGAAALTDLPNAKTLRDPRDSVFDQMFGTYAVVRVIVEADRSAAQREPRGSSGYEALLDEKLSSATIRQLSAAASMIGSFWLTAWQEAQAGSGTRREGIDHPTSRG
jgi:hypothetical protein